MSRVPVKIIHRLRSACLEGYFIFLNLKGEIWIPVGLVVPWWSSFATAFVDTRAGCPFVVSGSRGFCRHGGRLPFCGLGLQER